MKSNELIGQALERIPDSRRSIQSYTLPTPGFKERACDRFGCGPSLISRVWFLWMISNRKEKKAPRC